MSTEQDRDLQEILYLQKEVQKFFSLSIPGFLWFLGMFTAGGVGQKIVDGVTQHHSVPEALHLVIPFALWLVLFEQSEKNMEILKQKLREYIHTHGTNPVSYTGVEHTVNFIMKWLWDNSPLPPET